MMSDKREAPTAEGGASQQVGWTTDDTTDVSTVHPVSDVFPMLTHAELDDLAADISENGLQQPIVLQDGMLLDGRNRLEACRRAGVKPAIRELGPDIDPVSFILSANLSRRHMSKGAQAVALARAEMASGGVEHGRKEELSSGFGISTRYLRMARKVMEDDGDLAGRVIAEEVSLREAYDRLTRPSQMFTIPATLDEAITRLNEMADDEEELRIKRETIQEMYDGAGS